MQCYSGWTYYARQYSKDGDRIGAIELNGVGMVGETVDEENMMNDGNRPCGNGVEIGTSSIPIQISTTLYN